MKKVTLGKFSRLIISAFFLFIFNCAFCAELKIQNTSGDFLNFMQIAKSSPPEKRFFIWYQKYFLPNKDFLCPIFFPNGVKEKEINQIKEELETILLNYDKYFQLFSWFDKEAKSHVEEMMDLFKKKFSDFQAGENEIVILCGCPFFNAKADLIKNKNCLLLSADTFFNVECLKITIQHELFHLYHMKKFLQAGNKIVEKLYFPLLFEGCAVFYTYSLFPELSINKHFMVESESYVKDSERDLPKILPNLLSKIASPNVDDLYNYLFKVKGGAKVGLNDRIGYYIGFQILRGSVNKISLNQVIAFSSSQMISFAKNGIEKIMKDRKIK